MDINHDFKLIGDINLEFSVFEDKLLFIHSSFLSGQYALDLLSVQILLQPKNVKVMLFLKGDLSVDGYLGFYFNLDQFVPLVDFFKSLGFANCDKN